MTELAGTIVVSRPGNWHRDALRAYLIRVDGFAAGKVRKGRQITINVTPGLHRVRALIDWSGSPELEVHVDAGATAHLIVEPAGSPFELWQALGTTRWLQLWQAS